MNARSKILQNVKIIKSTFRKIDDKRSTEVADWIAPYIKDAKTILDIGPGFCTKGYKLGKKGFEVTQIDVENLSLLDEVTPIIYDGDRLPYDDKSFDVAMLLTVLHHTYDPRKLLSEAQRVAHKIVLLEDIYNSTFEKYVTFAADSIVNVQLIQPHTNKSDAEWRELFKEMGLKVLHFDNRRHKIVFNDGLYILEC